VLGLRLRAVGKPIYFKLREEGDWDLCIENREKKTLRKRLRRAFRDVQKGEEFLGSPEPKKETFVLRDITLRAGIKVPRRFGRST